MDRIRGLSWPIPKEIFNNQDTPKINLQYLHVAQYTTVKFCTLYLANLDHIQFFLQPGQSSIVMAVATLGHRAELIPGLVIDTHQEY